ncbi:MAG TPA: lysophospholipid acyltransferase family protein [Usitatibacter sp.]|nr:lysophospholipid acyltransferase family protein [Usitatibacter sp.]
MRALRWTRMLGHALAATAILKFVFPRADPARRRELVRRWSAQLVRIMGVTVRTAGPVPPAAEIGAMIAANHVSWLDIFVISSVRSTRFIAKSEIRDWPLAGAIAERAGTIFIRREKRRDTARINELVHEALLRGDCVGLFPEGTTTDGDTLLRFHSSLFEPAVANEAHVHPCAVRYENPDGTLCRRMAFVGELSFMQSLGLAIRQRGVVARVSFAPTIETAGRHRRDVAAAAHASVASLLGLPPPGTAPSAPSGPPAGAR